MLSESWKKAPVPDVPEMGPDVLRYDALEDRSGRRIVIFEIKAVRIVEEPGQKKHVVGITKLA